MSVLVLQALAVERGAARSRPKEEALGPDIARQPHQVPDALEAEHRVIYVEGHHVAAMRGVGRACRHKRRHRTRLGDPLFKNLPVLRLVIVKQRFAIHRLVKLPLGRVDADLAEQRVQAECARLVWYDRHDLAPDLLVPNEQAQQPHEPHRRGQH